MSRQRRSSTQQGLVVDGLDLVRDVPAMITVADIFRATDAGAWFRIDDDGRKRHRVQRIGRAGSLVFACGLGVRPERLRLAGGYVRGCAHCELKSIAAQEQPRLALAPVVRGNEAEPVVAVSTEPVADAAAPSPHATPPPQAAEAPAADDWPTAFPRTAIHVERDVGLWWGAMARAAYVTALIEQPTVECLLATLARWQTTSGLERAALTNMIRRDGMAPFDALRLRPSRVSSRAIVRRVLAMNDAGAPDREIADALNLGLVLHPQGLPWTAGSVRELLIKLHSPKRHRAGGRASAPGQRGRRKGPRENKDHIFGE